MSILNVDEIRDETSSTTIAPSIPALEPRFIDAWINFNGTGTLFIRASVGFSSVADSGVGVYDASFLTSFGNLNYSAVASSSNVNTIFPLANYLATSIRIQTTNQVGSNGDSTFVNLHVASN